MDKKIIIFYLTLIFTILYIPNISAESIADYGQNESIACLNKNGKSYTTCSDSQCKNVSSCKENSSNIINSWRLSDSNKTSVFCLDHGKHMNSRTSMSYKEKIQDKKISCGIYAAYRELAGNNNSNYSNIINNMNKAHLSNKEYIVIQKNLWAYEKNTGTCKDEVLYLDNTSAGKINLSISSFELTLDSSNRYFISQPITVSTSNLNSSTYNIKVEGANGAFVTNSVNGTSALKNSNSKTLYVKIPKASATENTNIKLIVSGSYSRKKVVGKNATITVYDSGKKDFQRMGKINLEYEEKNITNTVERNILLNIKTCSQKLNDLGKNPSANSLIDLYKYYIRFGKDFRGLLNFDNPSCKVVSCNYSNNASCLSGNFGQVANFNSKDVSCFNERYDVNGKLVFCLSTFNLENKLGKTSFTSPAGQMVISNPYETIATTGKLVKQCYSESNSSILSTFNAGKYSDYVKGVNFDNRKLYIKDDINKPLQNTKKIGNWYEYSTSMNYYLNGVYAANQDAEISYSKCTNCKFLGYGIVSKFIESSNNEIPFSIDFVSTVTPNKKPNLKFDKSKYTKKCLINSEPGLICDPKKEKCDSENGNIKLGFRLIDTSNPFPGKSGEGRRVGSNWCSKSNCSSDNQIVKKVIKEANNSYNKNKTGPIYRITLNLDIINKIRKYNETKNYDDYTLKCNEDGNNCKSIFLEKYGIKRLK